MIATHYPTPTVRPFDKTAFAGTDAQLLDFLAEAVDVDNIAESRVYAGLHALAVSRGLIAVAA